jgi:hypothetical protein
MTGLRRGGDENGGRFGLGAGEGTSSSQPEESRHNRAVGVAASNVADRVGR